VHAEIACSGAAAAIKYVLQKDFLRLDLLRMEDPKGEEIAAVAEMS
jgi:hypothetical protein